MSPSPILFRSQWGGAWPVALAQCLVSDVHHRLPLLSHRIQDYQKKARIKILSRLTHTVQATKESWSVTTIFYSDQLQHFQPSGPETMGFWSATTVQGWRVPPMESSLLPLFSSFTINFNGILFNMWFSSSFNFQRNYI